jgi:uncharacterized membrane protein SpoIIM required for sporulation
MSTFIARYKKDWQELEALIHRSRSWFRPLSFAERERLDVLYRRTTVHLARVSTRSTDQSLINYLNDLTAAAHTVIYLPPRQSVIDKVGRFLVEGFARSIARHWRPHLFSAVLVIGGALIGFFAAMADPILAHALWPSADERQPGSTSEQLLSHLRYGREEGGSVKFLFASFLFQHNLKVGILAMALGVLASVPTIFLMIFNGMLLGVFAAIHYQAGIRAEMWAWILPHGITEIGAIILCGGIGLMLGAAVVKPGMVSRTKSLVNTGREAAKMCLGAGLMLVFAAVIESYLRQSNWPTTARLIFAAGTALFWTLYIAHGFHRERQMKALPKRQPPVPATVTTDSAAAAR